MHIDGSEYLFTLASDLARDGMALECERLDAGGARTLVMEAFWCDATGRFTFRSCADQLPFGLVQAFVRAAAERCPPTASHDVGTRVLIHVKLLDEDVDVWRPVTAEIELVGVYRIISEPSDDETWEFPHGARVRCKQLRFSDGATGLVAVEGAG